MQGKVSENLQVEVAIDSADIDTSDVSSAVYYPVKGFKKIYAKCKTTTNLTSTKTLTLQLKQATSAEGAGAKALGDAQVFTADTTEKGEIYADSEVDALDADNGFLFVGVTVGSTLGSAVAASAVIVLADPVYAPVA